VRITSDEKDKFYDGCYCVAVITFFPYDKAGNRGVSCQLESICKVADGEAFSRSNPDKDYAEEISKYSTGKAKPKPEDVKETSAEEIEGGGDADVDDDFGI